MTMKSLDVCTFLGLNHAETIITGDSGSICTHPRGHARAEAA